MADGSYIDVPFLDQLVLLWESDHTRDDFLKAMIGGILSYYFPVAEGYINLVMRKRNDDQLDSFIMRLQSFEAWNSGLKDVALIGGMNQDSMSISRSDVTLKQLETALSKELFTSLNYHLDPDDSDAADRCWAMIFNNEYVSFYEYHDNLPKHHLIQWVEDGNPSDQTYHIRDEAESIDRIMRHMVEHTEPTPRKGRPQKA